MDTFLYNGPIERGKDLDFIEMVAEKRTGADQVNLVLVTSGGSPDAAYKIARYLQTRYSRFSVTVSGVCKSAGTLLAIGAHEIVFAPYGELGPLDVQMSKADNLAGLESGLNISEAFQSLEQRAARTFARVIDDILNNSGGIVSFHTASHSATEVVAALYGPIFARIDPEEVGSRSRAMRIGQDYGKRLDAIAKNLKRGALMQIAQTYPSHGFVIDHLEAVELFNNVRECTPDEIEAIKALKRLTRMPRNDFVFDKIEWPEAHNAGNLEDTDAQPQPVGGGEAENPAGDAEDSQGAG